MSERLKIRDQADIEEALQKMALEIQSGYPDIPALIGIRRGGVPLSEQLADILAESLPERPLLGVVDINLYRDDWTMARSFPKVGRTEIPFSLEGRRVVLVDDVLYTGRTVKAALEVLGEFGRASRVELAVLVDRGHREMPIQADYAPFAIPTRAKEMVEVSFDSEGRGEGVFLLRA
ncbi:MAG: bifunctional pyr operon transcriptional regulator/uracil phosphoribosyltransferase PyrR [Deltaproteobacteria bacterium]|jgi:pyrimidine operon attenuation protein/uracil phosphoribosyltransferase|nr:bifunctional pyr operon transcriptional regulator/uracil phosphoribosyltransferase PyrR [Deltaproteobacteria bacterium]